MRWQRPSARAALLYVLGNRLNCAYMLNEVSSACSACWMWHLYPPSFGEDQDRIGAPEMSGSRVI